MDFNAQLLDRILRRGAQKPKLVPLSNKDALLTHYALHQNDRDMAYFKEEALAYTESLLQTEFPEKNITKKEVEKNLKNLFESQTLPFKPSEKCTFKFIDLFAGIGGFRLALQNLGGKCVYTSEFEPNAKITYATNFGEIPFGDITKDSTKAYIPEKFDILCGGFPCQAFSIAGHRKGFADTRGTLFFDIEQIIEKHRPKAVFLENVKNLISHDKGKTFKVLLEILQEKLGYHVFYKVLNSMTHTNIPQNRERIFIVAFDPRQVPNYDQFSFPEEITRTSTIHDILEKGEQAAKYYYAPTHMYYPELEKTMVSTNTIYQWRRVYVRENKSNVCPTLTANMGGGGHNVPLVRDKFGIRKLTPRECFSFQGYPSNYVLPTTMADSRLYTQAGNSVTVPLIQSVAENIIKVLNKN